MISYQYPAKLDKQATILLASKEQVKKRDFANLNSSIHNEVCRTLDINLFSGEREELFPVVIQKQIVLLVGIGDENKLSLTALRVVLRNALLSSYLKKTKEIEIIPPIQNDNIVKAAIEGIVIGTYSWEKYKTQDKNKEPVSAKKIFIAAPHKKEYEDAERICAGVNCTRDLVNDNADTITATYVEKIIRGLVQGKKNITLEVLNKKELARHGLGLHLAVNQGSAKEPRLIIVRYHGSLKSGDYTAIIGKGMTFDTGGLNLKPSGHIETMRIDMSGAAAVVGLLKNTIALNLRKNILFVCAMAENAIGAEAYKPGDVICSYSGKTVEIGNTDAEGRLVLADAMSYLVKNYKPARMIDIATLTGACVIALGHDYTGLVTNDDKLFQKLSQSADATDDRLWRLPIYPELKDAVKSQIADIKNVGLPKGAAGTITAAEFLHQFTEGTPWAHLDIAGTAFVENKQRMYFGHGATGASVRLLTHFLQYN